MMYTRQSYSIGGWRPLVSTRFLYTALRYCFLGLLILQSACGGSGDSGGGGGGGDPNAGTRAVFSIYDGAGVPISDAAIALGTGPGQQIAITDSRGAAWFTDLSSGSVPFSVTAAGFESLSGYLDLQGESAQNNFGIYLSATDAWANPRIIVFATQVIERASNGSEMTFSTDVAVIDGSSDALETLTSTHFSLGLVDCGFAGPRGSASDADGNSTGCIGFTDGHPLDFGLLPPEIARPFYVDLLVEISDAVLNWGSLKPFFKSIGSNDAVSLASVRLVDDSETYTVHGPFTNDGRSYFDAINTLAGPASDRPPMVDSLVKSIQRVAGVVTDDVPGPERAVVVALSSSYGLEVDEIETVTAAAKEHSVKVSVIGPPNYGFPEVAVRTGGFSVQIDDRRQRAFVMRAMAEFLAGTTPRYRMTFHINGEPGTFVSGGNAKVTLRVAVPDSIRHFDPYTYLDIAIP